MDHRHKAIKSMRKESAWQYCVAPDKCKGNDETAHGNIVREDVCLCGAVRLSEVNGGRTNFAQWLD